MSTKVQIIRAEAVGEVRKDSASGRFGFDIRYTLADGRTVRTGDYRRLKRDAVKSYAKYPLNALEITDTRAIFVNAVYVGVERRFHIGAGS